MGTISVNKKYNNSKSLGDRISKGFENANSYISKSQSHLNNCGYKSDREVRSTLSSIYKNNSDNRDKFSTFVNNLESFMRDLEETDKRCAANIKKNGESNRQKNGMPKNITKAAIQATFSKLKNKFDDVKEWFYDAKEWFKDFMSSDGLMGQGIIQMAKSALIMIGGAVAAFIIAKLGIVVGAVTATAALSIVAVAAVSFALGFDKFLSGLGVKLGYFELNKGDTLLTSNMKKIPVIGVIGVGLYKSADFLSKAYLNKGKLNKVKKPGKIFRVLNNNKLVKRVKNSDHIKNSKLVNGYLKIKKEGHNAAVDYKKYTKLAKKKLNKKLSIKSN